MVAWILISIAVLVLLLGIVAIALRRKGKIKETDYYSLFVMGAIWVPFGVIMMMMEPEMSIGNIFFILGWIYFVMGVANKDKWKKNKQNALMKTKWGWIIAILLGLLVAVGLVAFLMVR